MLAESLRLNQACGAACLTRWMWGWRKDDILWIKTRALLQSVSQYRLYLKIKTMMRVKAVRARDQERIFLRLSFSALISP